MAKNYTIEDKDERTDLGSSITEGWESDNQTDRAKWIRDLPRWLDAYQGRPQLKTLPWEGASNLFVPITATVVDAIHPRIMASLFKPTPIVSFKPVEQSDDDMVRQREVFLDYAVREEINLFPTADRLILGMLLNGIQVAKVAWNLETRNVRDKHEFDMNADPVQCIQTIMKSEQVLADAISKISDQDAYEVTKNGKKIKLEVVQKNGRLCIYTEREEVIRQCPQVSAINPEDISFNSDCPYDLQKADHIYERYWLTMDQIRREVKKGIFDASDTELEEIEKLADVSIDEQDETTTVKTSREEITGAAETFREGDPEKVELIDAYIKYDINDDGFDEEIIVTVPRNKSDIILRVNRLEDVYRHGYRPFVMFYMNPISNTIWSQGIPQMVEPLQNEINVIHNQRVDAGQINNTPFGWFQPGAGMSKDRMPIRPGYMNPVADVNQVKMHVPSNVTQWGFQEEQNLYTLLERRTKVSDITIGRTGEFQGAARTATGVQALNAQQATGFDIYIRRVQEGWKNLLQQIMALYQQYMPKDRFYRIVGNHGDPDYVVSKENLMGKMDMIFTGNSLSTDREVERNTTTFLAQSTFSPQALGFMLQLQVINPQGVAEWYRHMMKVFDVPNFDRIIMIPPMPKIRDPQEVLNRLLSGEKLIPKEGEDHNGVIMMITQYMSSQDAVEAGPEIIVLMQQQIGLRQVQAANEQVQKMMQQAMMQQQMQMAQQSGALNPYLTNLGAPVPPLANTSPGLALGRTQPA